MERGLRMQELRRKIELLEVELSETRQQLEVAESEAAQDRLAEAAEHHGQRSHVQSLKLSEYKRYGRQLIMPEVGLRGQLKLKTSSVLIVGAGGLGSSASAYLAGAGVGTIGLADGDVVEESNLHRQIVHSTSRIGMLKVDSAIEYLRSLNPNVTYVPHRTHLSSENALNIIERYEWILDCTDMPATRYLVSDACVIVGRTLISASALQGDGQLMIFNSPARAPGDATGGPCYRCMFPKPPPAETVLTCGEGGILGPVVGTMGILQALATIRLILATASGAAKKIKDVGLNNDSSGIEDTVSPSGLLFSGFGETPFRSFKMRKRRAACSACSIQASITAKLFSSGGLDYQTFCGAKNPRTKLGVDDRMSATEFTKARAERSISIDTRDKTQFDICHLDESINIPIKKIMAADLADVQQEPEWLRGLRATPSTLPIYVICRLGNDSQEVVAKLKELGLDDQGERIVRDVVGGLHAYTRDVDPTFPEY